MDKLISVDWAEMFIPRSLVRADSRVANTKAARTANKNDPASAELFLKHP
jgi:hypothetical protein